MFPRRSLWLVLAAGACTDSAGPAGPGITGAVARIEVPVNTSYELDLLFVIDNSPAMAPRRAQLIENYRRFIAALEAIPGGLPDLHIGVVTTDVGTRGAHDAGPGPTIGTGAGACTSDGERGNLRRLASADVPFLVDTARPDGSRERSFTGSLADAFAQLADVGAAGCTYARPLEAIRRALLGNPVNDGFLRPDADLAVVLLTSDDDCSFTEASFTGGTLDRARCQAGASGLVPVDEYARFLSALEPESRRVLVLGAFAQAGAPACADARPAARLTSLLGAFPLQSRSVSICEPDLSGALEPVRHPLRPLAGPPCFSAPLLDLDPAADGLQAECAAWYRYHDDGAAFEELLPVCRDGASAPCYRLYTDPQACPTGEAVELRHRRGLGFATGARAILECVTR